MHRASSLVVFSRPPGRLDLPRDMDSLDSSASGRLDPPEDTDSLDSSASDSLFNCRRFFLHYLAGGGALDLFPVFFPAASGFGLGLFCLF